MKPITFRDFWPAILWFTILMVLICLPGKELPKLGKWFDLFSMDKGIHAILFGGLSFLSFRPIYQSGMNTGEKKDWLTRICLSAAIWGLGTELIQKFWVEGRSFDLRDWLADSIGAAIYWTWMYLKINRQKQAGS